MRRRWIATARSNSISCSVIAHASASHGSGLRRTRRCGSSRSARPMKGSPRKRSCNSRGSSSTPVAKRMRRSPSRAAAAPAARAPKATRSGAIWTAPTTTGSPSTCSSRWTRRPAAPEQPVRRVAAQLERPRRRDLHAELDGVVAFSVVTATIFRHGADGRAGRPANRGGSGAHRRGTSCWPAPRRTPCAGASPAPAAA